MKNLIRGMTLTLLLAAAVACGQASKLTAYQQKEADSQSVYQAEQAQAAQTAYENLLFQFQNLQQEVTEMKATFEEIKAKSVNEGKTVYFEVSPLQWGLWTAGSGTFMDELAEICGLTNAFSDVEGWAAISEEQVLDRNPDYIVTITMYYGEGPTPVEEIMSREGWSELKAVSGGDILNAESNAISRPGPRLKDAAIELYEFINNAGEEEVPAA